MAFPTMDNFRELLPLKVRLGADDLSAQMQGFLGTEHNEDGSHADITTGDIDATGTIAAPAVITGALVVEGLSVQGRARAYTPTWGGSGSNPTRVNGTLTGRYQQVGDHVTFSIRQTLGSSDVPGTGFYYYSLPTQPDEILSIAVATFVETATGKHFLGGIFAANPPNPIFGLFSADPAGTNVPWGPASGPAGVPWPIAWTPGNRLCITGTYFIA